MNCPRCGKTMVKDQSSNGILLRCPERKCNAHVVNLKPKRKRRKRDEVT